MAAICTFCKNSEQRCLFPFNMCQVLTVNQRTEIEARIKDRDFQVHRFNSEYLQGEEAQTAKVDRKVQVHSKAWRSRMSQALRDNNSKQFKLVKCLRNKRHHGQASRFTKHFDIDKDNCELGHPTQVIVEDFIFHPKDRQLVNDFTFALNEKHIQREKIVFPASLMGSNLARTKRGKDHDNKDDTYSTKKIDVYPSSESDYFIEEEIQDDEYVYSEPDYSIEEEILRQQDAEAEAEKLACKWR